VGGANWDYLAHGAALPQPGGTVRGDSFQEAPGGKGVNQAIGAARLGARTSIVARIATDAHGKRIVERLRTEGVGTDYIVRDDAQPTDIAVIQVGGDGEKQILTTLGANTRLSVNDVHAARSARRAD
jgi:ribokinase